MFMAKTLTEISKPLQPVLDAVTDINGIVNGFVWGSFGIGLLLAAGILMTFINKGFQFTHIGHWFKNTIGAIFADKHVTKHTGKDDKSISQFQSLCTALAATIGTGNIVGIASFIFNHFYRFRRQGSAEDNYFCPCLSQTTSNHLTDASSSSGYNRYLAL